MLNQLRFLDLSGNKIEDTGLRFLIESLPQMEKLRLRRCDLGDQSARLISERLLETKQEVCAPYFFNTYEKLDIRRLL